MTTIHDKPTRDRPREKLQARGPAALSDFELLQALIGSGNKQADVTKIARNTLTLFKQYGANVSYEQLQQVTGLGPARITEILSALELSKRYLIDSEQPIIDSPEKAVELFDEIAAGQISLHDIDTKQAFTTLDINITDGEIALENGDFLQLGRELGHTALKAGYLLHSNKP
ncbi:MAG TPA: hypothetical protein PLZ58_03690 [Candidatus Saccharibacteria bacterium]|nr:hypothetical protein [Candidatus Saccharibacteria bacterium]HRQ06823.1 hypothetical protein [Candidatus Saccharibacteria bacterium]